MRNLQTKVMVFILSLLLPSVLYSYNAPDPVRTFYGDATGDMSVAGDDLSAHRTVASGGSATYATTQPQTGGQYWNTCDLSGDGSCAGDDIPSLIGVASGGTTAYSLSGWAISNYDLNESGNTATISYPFRLNVATATMGRPGIIIKVTIESDSTTTGSLVGRTCTPGSDPDELNTSDDQCAVAVTVTDFYGDATIGPTESGTTGLQIQADGAGTIHLLAEVIVQTGLLLPAMTLDLYPEFLPIGGNTAPVNNAPTSTSGDELTAISFDTAPTDGDVPEQILTSELVDATGACADGSLTGDVWSWTPTEADGPTSCDVVTRVYDGVDYSANATTHVVVNEVNVAPTDNATDIVTGNELSEMNFDVNPTDPDVPSQSLTCSLVSAGGACASGSLVGCSWSWTPTETDGPTSCDVETRVYDGVAYSSSWITHVVVDEVNDSPTDNAPANASGNELTAIGFSVSPTDSDIPVQGLVCSVVSASGACASGSLVGCGWSWTPTEADGPTSCDVVTRSFDGVDYSLNQTTHIIVNEVNVAPTDNAPANASGNELTAITFNVAPTDSDIPVQGLVCSVVSAGGACASGSLVGCGWSWTPTEADGPTSCDVVTRVYDGVDYSANATTHVVVAEVNVAPTNNAPANASGDEMTAISFGTSPTDSDVPTQTLTSSVVSATGYCVNGSFTGDTWSWTPTEAQGPTTCSVLARVSDGVANTDVRVNISVSEDNQTPTWTSAPSDLVVGFGAVYSAVNGQASDADLPNTSDGDPGYLTCYQTDNTCSFDVTVSGAGAGAVGCATSFTAGTSAETCSVTYEATDEYGATVSQSVSITVKHVWYVNDNATGSNNGTSWANAYTTIQAAVNAASAGEMVWVAEGTYSTSSATNIVTMKSQVDIYGGFVGNEVSLSQRGNPANYPSVIDGLSSKYHCVIAASSSRLDGFTVKSGNAGTSGNDSYGGGIYCYNVSGFTLANCIVRNNSAKNYGGGMYNRSSTLTVTNCKFVLNTARYGGGMLNYTASPTITDSNFDLNTGTNDGGGMYNYTNASPTITNCRFTGNVAQGTGNNNGGGAIINESASATIVNTIFIGNSSVGTGSTNGGGAMFNYSSTATSLFNCTFNANTSGSNGGAIYNYSSSPAITNCIFWKDTATTGAEIANASGSTPSVNYSDVDGGYSGGTGNINANPSFVGYPLSSGTWSAAATYSSTYAQSTLTDGTRTWTPNALAGLYVNPDTAQTKKYLILSNTATTMTIWSSVTGFVALGDTYQIFDYHVQSGSPCVDAGTSSGAPSDDLDGYERPSGLGYDMGVYEYQAP